MAELHQTPTSLCCCRKPPPVGASGRPQPESPGRGPGTPPVGPPAGRGPGTPPVGPPAGRGPGTPPVGPPAGRGPGTPRAPPVDVASASNFRCFRLLHLHLDLRINFAVKELSGWAVLDLVPVRPGVRTLVLDCHPSLAVRSVACRAPGARRPEALAFRLAPFADYGTSLSIGLPAAAPGRPLQVTVRYSATDGPAVWWLEAPLTCGRARPLLFTQSHAVGGRSLFPGFDTPAVKSPYTAAIRAPDGVTVLMSASRSSYSHQDRLFHFSMELPVPSYLVALVAGELQHAELGPRTRVWAEPCLLACAVKKLGGSVERWLGVAERLFGPYLWGRCDLVFLPPSFPLVAMENPCLTFIIASLLESSELLFVDLVHEVAHGWFGNAVTNASWEEAWLSEGLATYAQRRITTELYGEAFTCLETSVRLHALRRQLRLLGDDSPASRLQAPLEPGVNPISLVNLFTYEKGFCFVAYLSELTGDGTRFDLFLKDFVCEFRFQSVGSQDFLQSFLSYFPDLKDVSEREGLEFWRWLRGPGPPPVEPRLSAGAALTRPVGALCALWGGGAPDPRALETFDLSAWSTFQIVLFLDRMLDMSPLPPEVMPPLASSYSLLLSSRGSEVQLRWLQTAVRNSFSPELPGVRAFLLKHTSRMYTVPLYDDLVAGVMKCVAVEMFNQTRRRLHPNLRRTLQQIVFQSGADQKPPGPASTDRNAPALSVTGPSPSPSPSPSPPPCLTPFQQPVATATAFAAAGASVAPRAVVVSA